MIKKSLTSAGWSTWCSEVHGDGTLASCNVRVITRQHAAVYCRKNHFWCWSLRCCLILFLYEGCGSFVKHETVSQILWQNQHVKSKYWYILSNHWAKQLIVNNEEKTCITCYKFPQCRLSEIFKYMDKMVIFYATYRSPTFSGSLKTQDFYRTVFSISANIFDVSKDLNI